MMTMHRVAALQMVSGNDLEANLKVAEQLIAQAAEGGSVLAVLPETFALFSTGMQRQLGEQEAGGSGMVRRFLCEQARKHKLWLVGGTVPMADCEGDKVYSSAFVIDASGKEVARYNKMHLFDVDVSDAQGSYRESDTFAAGDDVVTVDTPLGRLGVAVCYDIRFPELFRAMLKQGVDIIAVPSAFTLFTGEAHWLALLRARAIETQCYIVGANQGGRHSSSRYTSGGSVIIDGWGTVLAEAPRGEMCLMAELDTGKLSKLRRNMPVKNHLRFDVVPVSGKRGQ